MRNSTGEMKEWNQNFNLKLTLKDFCSKKSLEIKTIESDFNKFEYSKKIDFSGSEAGEEKKYFY